MENQLLKTDSSPLCSIATSPTMNTLWEPSYYTSNIGCRANYIPSYGTTYSSTTIIPEIMLGGCPACRVGVIKNDYTFLGLLCAILLFPFGIICCKLLKTKHCSNCGAYFS